MFALTRAQLVFFFYSHENEKLIESEMCRKDDFMYVPSADCVLYLHRSPNRRKITCHMQICKWKQICAFGLNPARCKNI